MNEMISMSVDIHIFFVFLMLVLAVMNIFVVKSYNDYVKMTKKIEFFSPLYYLSLSVVIFTGSVVLAVYKFRTNLAVFFMIFVSLIIIVSAVKNHKLFKKTRMRDIKSQEVFKSFATKKYLLDIVLMSIAIVLAFVLA